MANKRRFPRHPSGLLVKLRFDNMRSFIENFATNVSSEGLFIRTRKPLEVGTPVRFEIQLASGQRAMKGKAIVRWSRQPEDPVAPPGMGLELTGLDPTSRLVLDQMLALTEGSKKRREPDGAAPAGPSIAAAAVTPPVAEGVQTAEPLSMVDSRDGQDWEYLNLSDEDLGIDEQELLAATPPPIPAANSSSDDDDHFGFGEDVALDVDLAAEDAELDVDLADDIELDTNEEDIDLDFDIDLDNTTNEVPSTVFLKPPASVLEEGPVIGIDLGTTNSCVAVFKNGRPVVIRSREGYNTVPSIIALSAKDRLLVGHPARSQMLTNPQRTVYGAKRLVGRRFDSATVRQVAERFHYPVCADKVGRAAVRLNDNVVSLEEVQGLVLAECKAMAEEALEQPVHRAVVTVPAYYTDSQRQAVRESARLAGLKVERILNEPTAAALAYGLNRQLKKRILVYDLGGGTFDATAMQIDGNVFEVLATGGDTFLGGVDFDNQIIDRLLTRFNETTHRDFAGDHVALSRVADAAERAKIELSQALTHEVSIPFLMMDPDGLPVDLRCSLTREDIEQLTIDLVERSLDVVRDVLLDAGLKPSDVEDVILVGGQSRMPLVRQKIGELFGREPHPGVHPDEAVGLGAALLASSFDRIGSIVLIDVLPMTIGVGLPGGRFKRVIERNTPLPTQRTYTIASSKKNQRELYISIFQGEDDHVSGNEYLGTLTLADLPRGPRGNARASVTFNLGPECVLDVTARDVTTGQEVRSRLATKDTPEAIRKLLGIDPEVAMAAQAQRKAELEQRGGRFWGFLRRVIGSS